VKNIFSDYSSLFTPHSSLLPLFKAMNYTVEKNERYALVRLNEANFGGDVPAGFEQLCLTFFREGYSNIIVEIASATEVDTDGINAIRKVNRKCLAEEGLFVVVTKNDDMVEYLDDAKILDLTILPTVEEAVDAVFMSELENDFRNEDDSEYGGQPGSGSEY
jgi:hypothetical protein